MELLSEVPFLTSNSHSLRTLTPLRTNYNGFRHAHSPRTSWYVKYFSPFASTKTNDYSVFWTHHILLNRRGKFYPFFRTLNNHLTISLQLAISAFLVARFNSNDNASSITERDRTRYVLFASIFTLVFSPFFLSFFLLSSSNILVSTGSHLIFLGLCWVIWTAAAAAVTDMLGGGLACGAQDTYVYCGQLNAMEAFAWILWYVSGLAFSVFLICR